MKARGAARRAVSDMRKGAPNPWRSTRRRRRFVGHEVETDSLTSSHHLTRDRGGSSTFPPARLTRDRDKLEEVGG